MSDGVKDLLLCIVIFIFGLIIGNRFNEVYLKDEPVEKVVEVVVEAPIPDCEEDEYLYPVPFDGWSKVDSINDLECVHEDTVIGSAVVVCPDGNIYYRPEETPC